jgi:hypothetical protein
VGILYSLRLLLPHLLCFSSLYTPEFFNTSSNPYSNEVGYTSVFAKYVKNIYGLTDQETEYVWEEYRNIILDKIGKIS